MSEDDLLERATNALREESPDAPGDPMATLRRIQVSVATNKKRQARRTRAILLPIAATLATSTAFAAVTGRLAPVFQAVDVALHPAREAAPTPPMAKPKSPNAAKPAAIQEPEAALSSPQPEQPETQPAPRVDDPTATAMATAMAPLAPVENAPRAAPAAARRAVRASSLAAPAHASPPLSVPSPPAPETPLADTGSTSPPEATPPKREDTPAHATATPQPPADPTDTLYRRAHAMHFGNANPAETLASWDAYLRASPNGRFAPEARFNRAVVLIKLGRRSEAKAALAPFANGAFGSYRREDAHTLLESLAAP